MGDQGEGFDQQLNSALNIMRRMPPSQIELSLSGLVNLAPDLIDELLQRVDQPLQLERDPANGKQYLMCDYNRDGDSYRSPWSNEYYPSIEDGFKPSLALRKLEEKCNAVFDTYRQLYYEGGVSSAYLWDQEEDASFAGCFLIKKQVIEPQRRVNEGSWDSIHIIEAIPQGTASLESGTFTYRLTSTVMLSMTTDKGDAGPVILSGSLTRQAKDKTLKIKAVEEHVAAMGSMIEDMEIDIRNQMNSLYIQKTREVTNSVRKPTPGNMPSQDALVQALKNKMRT